MGHRLMAGLNISAVRYGIAAAISAQVQRAVAVYAYPPAILQYPAISIDHAGGNYAVTFGAQGLAQFALRATVDVTAADMQAAAIALDDLLCAGTDATASVYDALTSGEHSRVDLKNPKNSLILTKTSSTDPDEKSRGMAMAGSGGAPAGPEGKAGAATGGSLFFTFSGVVFTPPAFNAVLAATGSYPVAYATFALPALAAGGWLLFRRPTA